MSEQPTILCLASYFKGGEFIEAAHAAGARVLFITQEKYAGEAWPRTSIDAFHQMPDTRAVTEVLHGVSYLARQERIDRIVALDDYDVLTAAALREHLRLPGLGDSAARLFRDKLAMRVHARGAGLRVPAFAKVFHHHDLYLFMEATPGPWLLKPRTEAGGMGIKLVNEPDALWPLLEQLGDAQSEFLLEQFVPGEVFHVDALAAGGEVLFTSVQQYSRPPLQVAHQGGVFISKTLPAGTPENEALLSFHAQFAAAFGLIDGVAHTEFIQAADGKLYFLETAARVGGANIADLIEAATGLNLWREWARLEVALARGDQYQLPPTRTNHAGVAICLAQQAYPDLSAYTDPEIVWRMHKKHHAGLIVAAPDAARVATLLAEYGHRFAHDFLAVQPPLDRAP